MTKDEALKKVLVTLEWFEERKHLNYFDWQTQHIADIKEALAQPEQELVELRTALAEALGDVYVCGRTWSAWGVGTMTQDDFYPAAESDEVLDSLVQAVATATPPPPKRPWVGLTDAERDECDWGQGERDYSLVIEAKLKEKNT